jgi:hypothetical protein
MSFFNKLRDSMGDKYLNDLSLGVAMAPQFSLANLRNGPYKGWVIYIQFWDKK